MTAWYSEGLHAAAAGSSDVLKRYEGTIFTYNNEAFSAARIISFPVSVFSEGAPPEAVRAFRLARSSIKIADTPLKKPSPDLSRFLTNKILLVVQGTRLENSTNVLFAPENILNSLADIDPLDKKRVAQFLLEMLGLNPNSHVKTGVVSVSSLDEINFSFPPLGYVNSPFGPFYSVRVPKRQWKRGVCRDTVSIVYNNVFQCLIRKVGLDTSGFHVNTLYSNIMLPKYKGVKDSIEYLLDGGSYGVALNKNICLSFLPNKKYEIGIFYKDLYVGNLTQEVGYWNIQLLPQASPFFDEINKVLGGLNE